MKMTEKHVDQALTRMGLTKSGPVRVGLLDSTVSVRAVSDSGVNHWVRVAPVRDETTWVRPNAIAEAQVLSERVPMPRIINRAEWEETDSEEGNVRQVRGEAFEYIEASPVSKEPAITAAPEVSDEWWGQLRKAHDIIQTSEGAGPGRAKFGVLARIRRVAGPDVDFTNFKWCASHGDFHWANLLSTPDLVIVDWEGYGFAPVGLDAATLLTYSLAHPPTADRVRNVFADLLEGKQGFLVQLYMAEMIMSGVRNGFHTHLEQPIREHVKKLLTG
jgi:hypothetical protein